MFYYEERPYYPNYLDERMMHENNVELLKSLVQKDNNKIKSLLEHWESMVKMHGTHYKEAPCGYCGKMCWQAVLVDSDHKKITTVEELMGDIKFWCGKCTEEDR
jgi:hypothetical protein